MTTKAVPEQLGVTKVDNTDELFPLRALCRENRLKLRKKNEISAVRAEEKHNPSPPSLRHA